MAEYKKGKYRELTANEEDRKIVPEPYGWGGGGGNVKFIMTQPKCVIRSEFSPMTLEILTSRRKKKSLCWEV